MDDCGLVDVGFSGGSFTWWNRRGGSEAIHERFDRALVSSSFLESCPSTILHHLDYDKSDHTPIKLSMFVPTKQKKGKRFRFEDMWATSKECEEVIRGAWAEVMDLNHGHVAPYRLDVCTRKLTEWSKVQFGDFRKKIDETRNRMNFLDSCFHDQDAFIERGLMCAKLDELLLAEETYWRQRSRVNYLMEGDKSTRFFHLKASNRKRRNHIARLKDEGGLWVIDEEAKRKLAMTYFDNLFASSNPSRMEEALSCIVPCVTDEIKSELLKPFTKEEVTNALNQMKPCKAPGPDGLNANFFQTFWHIIGNDVADYVIKCLDGREDITNVNHTHIVLISKIKEATELNNYRPISLCNVVYKLISKVLVGRHKAFLDGLIKFEQSAFIPGWLTSDNAIIAFESFHFLKSHHHGRKGYMSLKLDMSKAYDRVEWVFVERVMVKMGFAPRWVEMIMRCVRNVRSAILVIGVALDYIRPRRGLRQGDPLSPYLFILCANVFSRLISRDVERKSLHGLPAIVGRNKSVALNPVREMIWKKLKGWKGKLLSYSGREILIKAIAQSIPTYFMGLFKFPSTFCSEIEGDLARFWWAHNGEKQQIYWVALDKLCSAKQDGGLGFRLFETFNLAMLTKQLWRLYDRPQSLVSRLLAARYYPSGDILQVSIGHHPSFVWRSLMDAFTVFRSGSRWLIGDGRNIRFWHDQWSISEAGPRLLSPISGLHNSVVADWFFDDPIRWNEDSLWQHLYEFEVRDILRIPLCSTHECDRLVWNNTKTGLYTVKSGYHFIRGLQESSRDRGTSSDGSKLWLKIWRLKLPPKIKNLVRRVCKGVLPCGLNVQERVKDADLTCKRCLISVESETHALLDCSFARQGENVSKLMVLLWAIWNGRNEEYHGDVRTVPQRVLERALSYWNAWLDAQLERGEGVVRVRGESVRWVPPGIGEWKINVDAGLFGDMGCGLGMVVRDHEGKVERVGVQQVRDVWDPDIAEAKAAEFGLRAAVQMGLTNVVLESDSATLITMLKSKSLPANYLGRIGNVILELANAFSCIRFNFVRREGNGVAHSMAHLMPFDYSTRFWVGSLPEHIVALVDLDVASLFS
ncbi:uncharacterized protein LOC141631518 [Silene latifolia]|uniref:uncharacterized protein LOC141631518 n=1 Tax=Silene latifolia TaxID=37657 RepID=UPI003D7813AF